MMANKTHLREVREPLFHITKRYAMPWWKSWIIRVIAIVFALIVSAVVTIVLTGQNPVEVYSTMIKGAFGTPRRIWQLFQNVALLLCIALAITPAFKMRFWNIGAEGQVLVGGLATAACMISLGGIVPDWLLIVLMVISAVVAGAVWGIIPAFCKANWGTNETLFTLMMNYVAMQLIQYFVVQWEVPKGSGKIGIINQKSHAGWFPSLFGQDYTLNIIIVIAIVLFMYIYLNYSKHGYEISVVGGSENTARYIGINVKHVIVRTMALSGAICGIAGLLLVAGTNHTIATTTADNRGFTAIMVSWLAKFNPIYMVLTSFLLVFLDRGASEIATVFRLNEAFADIISGIILFFIIGSEFFINYKIVKRSSQKEVK